MHEKDVAQLNEKISIFETSANEWKKELQSRMATIEKLTNTVNERDNKIILLEKELRDRKDALEKQNMEVENMKKSVSDLEKSHALSTEYKEKELNDLKSELKSKKDEL